MKKTRKLLLLLAVVCTLLVCCMVSASAETEGYYTYTVTDGEATITAVDTAISGEVVIPETLGGVPVTTIGNYNNVFKDCIGITSITIPDSVTSICKGAFKGCTNLISFVVDEDNSSYSNDDSGVLFNKEKTILSCYPEGNKETTYIMPDGVLSIDGLAFSGCTYLTSITIPDSVTTIGYKAFKDCTGLTSITIPDSVTSIEEGVFQGCTNLISFVVDEDNLSYSTDDSGVLFTKEKTKLVCYPAANKETTYIMPDGVLSIDHFAFWGCTHLTSITISDGVWYIGEEAFGECTGLTSITIPNSVTSLGGFFGCTGLTSITIPDGVRSISTYAFEGCTGLTNVTIPDSVTRIYAHAFRDCTGLTSITIPDSVTTIGAGAFWGCKGLTSITIPDSVTSIGYLAFEGCRNLTSITIPDGVTTIEDSTFANCFSLTNITIPDSITSIGYSAFNGCSNLTSITIPNSVITIGKYAFYICHNLKNIIIGSGVTEIGEFAFRYSEAEVVHYVGTEEDFQKINVVTTETSESFNPSVEFHYIPNTIDCKADLKLPDNCEICADWAENKVEYSHHFGVYNYNNDATCTVDGTKTAKCPYCGEKDTITVENTKIGHSYSEWTYNWDENVRTRICARCNDTYSEEFEVTSNNGIDFIAFENADKEFVVENIENTSDTRYESAVDNVEDVSVMYAVDKVYDINLQNSEGVYVQPDNSVVVKLPVGDAHDYYKVYRVNDDNTCTDMNAYVEDGYAVFTTDHFSIYAVVDLVGNAEDYFETRIDENGCAYITGVDTSLTGDVIIPETIGGYKVIGIDSKAFEDCINITSITISDSVQYITSEAFYGCDSLETIWIGAGVIGIANTPGSEYSQNNGYTAFNGCTSLKHIFVSEDNSQYCSDEYGVLYTKSKSRLCKFPVNSDIKSYTVPDSVDYIEDHAFQSCKSLESVVIPEATVGMYAFAFCYNLSSVELQKVQVIYNRAFMQCTSLKSIVIPDTVHTIFSWAFHNCYRLNNIIIGSNVRTIGDEAFSSLSSDLKVHYRGTSTDWYNISKGTGNSVGTMEYIPVKSGYSCSLAAYKNSDCEICVAWVEEMGEKLHTYDNYKSNGDATCTEDGTKTGKCLNCVKTDTLVDVGSATGHSFTQYTSSKDYTCTEDGTKTAYCDNRCGEKETIADVGSATGHKYTNYISNNDYTCTVDGTKTATCDNGCGETDTVADEKSALGHSFTNYISNNDFTCTVDGTKTAVCDNGCGEEETVTDTDSKTGHSFTNYVSDNNATCTADGTKTAVCDNGCGEEETVTDTDSKTGHSFTNYVSDNNATCTADGTKTAVCDNGCGEEDTVTDTDSKTGHSFTNYVSDNNATCTEDGTKTAACDNGCGEEDTVADIDSKTGHSFGEWTYDWDNLVRTSKCLNCDEVKSGALEKAEDTENEIEILAPADPDTTFTVENVADEADERYVLVVETLESYEGDAAVETVYDITLENSEGVSVQPDGTVQVKLPVAEDHSNYKVFRINDDGTYTDMNATVVDGYVVFETDHFSLYVIVDTSEKHEHEYNGVVTTPATHTKEGVMTYTCSCGDSYTEAIEKDPKHHWELKYFAPTCTEDGYDLAVCACGDEFVYKTYVALNHKYDYKLNYAATHLKDGLETYTCSRCGYSYTNTLPRKTEHYYSYYTKTTEPTCTEQGYTLHECECGDSYKDNYKAALGHKRSPHGDWCDRCGATMAPAKPDTSKCSCNCHKTGFMGFIYKLQRFFWKLFKTNKTCACGTVHY